MLLKLVSDANDSDTLTLALRLVVLVARQATTITRDVLVLQMLAVILTRKAVLLSADSVACILSLTAPDQRLSTDDAVRELLLNFPVWRTAPVVIGASLMEQMRMLLLPACQHREHNAAVLVHAHALQHALDALREDCPDPTVAAKLGQLIETLALETPAEEMASCFERFLLSTFDRFFGRGGPNSNSSTSMNASATGSAKREGVSSVVVTLTMARVIALRALVAVSVHVKVRISLVWVYLSFVIYIHSYNFFFRECLQFLGRTG